MQPASSVPRKVGKNARSVRSMMATVSRCPTRCAASPFATATAASHSAPYVTGVSAPSSSRRWMCVRSGVRAACHSRTSISVTAAAGAVAAGAAGPAAAGAVVSAGPAVVTAVTRSAGVSAATMTSSPSRTSNACSRRTASSTRSRLPMPRSCSRSSSGRTRRSLPPRSSLTNSSTRFSTRAWTAPGDVEGAGEDMDGRLAPLGPPRGLRPRRPT